MLALLGFLLPQEVPLVWQPLEAPGEEALSLEISCAASTAGEIQIFHATTRGIRESESIRWPVSPSRQAFTYTFPLPDAPITGLRLDPVGHGGELTVRRLRVVDRRGNEIRRFTRQDVVPVQQIAEVAPLADGWKIVSAAGANDPFAYLLLPAPVLAKDLNHRNLLRCLVSVGYLALILWLLLLAVLFAFHRPAGCRDALRPMAFMAALAILFATVGNRGLIKNSVRSARFDAPVVAPAVMMEIDLASDRPATAQLFWDAGGGFNETDSARANYEPHNGLQTLRFALPGAPLKALRFDPLDDAALLTIRELRLVDSARRTLAVLPVDSLEPGQDIASLAAAEGVVRVATAAGRQDPILLFKPAAVAEINRALVPARP